mmetsp:Transcript_6664/g.9911  ORF Transcript_6664/g.9911 Transcript_6664/m.9911 type:complete len:180 (-) Transcript_6664:157-696(-)
MLAKIQNKYRRKSRGPKRGRSQDSNRMNSHIEINTGKNKLKKEGEESNTDATAVGDPLEMLILLPNGSTEQENSMSIGGSRRETQDIRGKIAPTKAFHENDKSCYFSSSKCYSFGHPNISIDSSQVEVCANMSTGSLNYSVSQCPTESFTSLCASSIFDSSLDINCANKETSLDPREEQ